MATLAGGSGFRVESSRIGLRRRALARVLRWSAMMLLALSVVTGWFAWALLTVAGGLACVASVAVGCSRRGAGALSVSARGLEVERGARRTVVPLGRVVAGWIVPRAFPGTGEGAATVEFSLSNGDVLAADVASADVGHAVLAAAGFGVAQRALRVRLGRWWDGLFLLGLIGLFGVLQMTPVLLLVMLWTVLPTAPGALLFGAVLAGLGYAGSRYLGAPELVIGADGVTFHRSWRARFVPWAALATAEGDGRDIVLRLRDGERVRLAATSHDPDRQAMVLERIRAAMALRPAGAAFTAPDTAGVLALLDRNGRSVGDWRRGLRALLAAAPGYRVAALTREDVARALADPGSAPERRVAAALALTEAGDPGAGASIRAAAAACASEPVRVALEGVLHGDLDDARMDDLLEMDPLASTASRASTASTVSGGPAAMQGA